MKVNKKLLKIFVAGFCMLYAKESFPQGQWVWLKGDTIANPAGTYGMQGIPSPANTPPGLYEFNNWVDSQGNLWIFGGLNINGDVYSDLWKYNTVTNEWTWMKGPGVINQPGIFGTQNVPSPLNNPPARGWNSQCWIDNAGNLWLFGGLGIDLMLNLRFLNDLWKYNTTTNEWTWMSGSTLGNQAGIYGTQTVFAPANAPGGRAESSASWYEPVNNELWLFGGSGYDASGNNGFLDDLWKYNIASGQWAWMNGNNFVPTTSPFANPVNYGSLGIPAPSNTPGGRMVYSSFQNANHLYLFGGNFGFYTNVYNDLWDYDIATNQWTWAGGTNVIDHAGNTGAQCIASGLFVPPGRLEGTADAVDQCGYFYVFGGNTLTGGYNDLWQYNKNTNEWKWLSGSVAANQNTVFGIQGIPSPANYPGNRGGTSAFWIDANNNFWLFGGYDRFNGGYLNEVWKFIPENGITSFSSSQPNGCAPLQVQFTNTSTECIYPKTYLWNFGDPASGANDTSTLFSPSHIYQMPGSYTVMLISEDCTGEKDTVVSNIIVGAGFQVSINAAPSSCLAPTGQATVMISGGASPFSFQWSLASSTSPSVNSLAPGVYTVTVTDSNGCVVTDSVIIGAANNLALDIGNDTALCQPAPLQLTANIPAVSFLWSTGDTGQAINVTQAGTYWLIASSAFCSDTDTVIITIAPQVDLGSNYSLCDKTEIVLSAGSYPGASFQWSTGESTPSIVVHQPGTYWVNVSVNNCLLTDSVEISDEALSSVYIPNAFTPNGDKVNDYLLPASMNIAAYHFSLFSRWGELIFETSDPAKAWDGTYKNSNAPVGVYVYVVSYTGVCNNLIKEKTKFGSVSLIR